MRLPHLFLENLCFTYSSADELLRALGEDIDPDEAAEIRRLAAIRLPPVTSPRALACMIGVNEGLIWSMLNRQRRYYRIFPIEKGRGVRYITAPRVALKVIQKWISSHLQLVYERPAHVFGFVPGLSHLDAAACHTNASWVLGFDIENFFPTTPEAIIVATLRGLGYNDRGATVIARLACYQGFLAQGAPTSPVLSNFALSRIDAQLQEIAGSLGLRLSRYADDIVFSGVGGVPDGLIQAVEAIFAQSTWRLAEGKTSLAVLPSRLKVHGLLVHGDLVRLTKGYRNKIRALRYLNEKGAILEADLPRVRGHLSYADSVTRKTVT